MTRILAAVVALAFVLGEGTRAQGIGVVGMLDTYADGRYDQAVSSAAALPDLSPFRLRFVQDTPRWVNADPARIQARSAVAAAFLLELTAARLETDWGRLADLIEYTCVQLRTTGTPSPFERTWHAASHAL